MQILIPSCFVVGVEHVLGPVSCLCIAVVLDQFVVDDGHVYVDNIHVSICCFVVFAIFLAVSSLQLDVCATHLFPARLPHHSRTGCSEQEDSIAGRSKSGFAAFRAQTHLQCE
jgi:hypothetical protein